jgi:hypothetical protein
MTAKSVGFLSLITLKVFFLSLGDSFALEDAEAR